MCCPTAKIALLLVAQPAALRLPPPASKALGTPPLPAGALSRRACADALSFALLCAPLAATAASRPESALLAELRDARDALKPLPALLDEEKWDAVRSVLKTPPVGLLWNLGESKNTTRLAR